MDRRRVCFGALGTQKDNHSPGEDRWGKWRPTVGLCLNERFAPARYEILYQQRSHERLAKEVKEDIESRSGVEVRLNRIDLGGDPWKIENVYPGLFDFFAGYDFRVDEEEYFVNISTGTHVIQISMFLLVEAGFVPAKLVQSSEQRREPNVIDLDLERFEAVTQRFRLQQQNDIARLKDHIDTINPAVDALLKDILYVASNFSYPILLTGETGVGKSSLAARIHGLRRDKGIASGEFIPVNCATLTGDTVRSELFGHKKGSFTGAAGDRKGVLELANKGTLFLDEIGELDLEVQKMLLTAIEDKKFRPLGSEKPVESEFYLIAGTNGDLREKVRRGEFRRDLLARIDPFVFRIPSLRERPEDIEPNIDRELLKFAVNNNSQVALTGAAREKYLDFATSPGAVWLNNFRDLSSSVIRMATHASMGRISVSLVEAELDRLRERWRESGDAPERFPLARRALPDRCAEFNLVQMAELEIVIEVCRASRSRADAGRKLYRAPGDAENNSNLTSRLTSFLERFGLDWDTVRAISLEG